MSPLVISFKVLYTIFSPSLLFRKSFIYLLVAATESKEERLKCAHTRSYAIGKMTQLISGPKTYVNGRW